MLDDMSAIDLRALATRPGPFASAYYDSSHNTEDAARQLALRWRSIAEKLPCSTCSPRPRCAAGPIAAVPGTC
ncbi:Uncharacterised protein [Mycobacteroides abscessus subsp. abscessus]|nr:Uncharacterised protein [Mycobacteroides abscessus subsp. abscessus]